MNGSLWASEWVPQAHIVVIDRGHFIDWIEGVMTWDRR